MATTADEARHVNRLEQSFFWGFGSNADLFVERTVIAKRFCCERVNIEISIRCGLFGDYAVYLER